ncbi:GNAT family N-acetyltransferase [Lactococcus garvieae]|uniref:GNAT family N-acetyltransferase n=1 Tax=Lactococcus garvieae TaxID=1363 RepID=UPI001F61BFDC|nr:GNAT family N-acetyltransferase [Lactococcus garvieae]MCI3859933.1 GNAT family N-acetyltransferase [Lactococcus garvieae]
MQIKQTRDTMSEIYCDALRIRNTVFVKEQGVPFDLEVGSPIDEAHSVHFVGYEEGKALATVRLLVDSEDKKHAVVQRMAVLKEERGKGYANVLLQSLLDFCNQSGITLLTLHAQLSAKGLYEKFGFQAQGETFTEAGIEHVTMSLAIK